MNPRSIDLEELLDAVVPASGPEIGPDRAALRVMVRQERARLHRARAMFATVTIAFVAMLPFWRTASRQALPVPAGPPVVAPLVIHQVDDQQLLALLKGTPAALMEWPDGERTLLVMER